jgi:hypothetical protein
MIAVGYAYSGGVDDLSLIQAAIIRLQASWGPALQPPKFQKTDAKRKAIQEHPTK